MRHPLCAHMNGMGDFWSDLWDKTKTSVSTSVETAYQNLPGQIQAELTTELMKDPATQTAIQEKMKQQAIQASAAKIVDLEAQLKSAYSKMQQMTASIPGGMWTVTGAGILGLYLLLRKK